MKRNQRSISVLVCLGAVFALTMLGCAEVANVPCNSAPSYRALPGQSVDLHNPCGENGTPTSEAWLPHDTFRLTNPPPGISVTTIVGPDGIAVRKLEAALTVAPIKANVPYAYEPKGNVPPDPKAPPSPPKGLGGTLDVKTVPELHVSVTAQPAAPGSTLLQASPTEGARPYSFSWSPSAGLDDARSAAPLASPAATTTYTVTVTDAIGQTASASVTVTVFPKATRFTLTVVNTDPISLGRVYTYPIFAILCPSTCAASFDNGTTVNVYESGLANAQWQGCNSVTNNGTQCIVVMDADKTVTVSP